MRKLERAKKSGSRYEAPIATQVGGPKMIFKILPLYLQNREERSPLVPPGPFLTDVSAYDQPPASGLRVTWFGHSSLLIELDGVTLLFDPVWDERAAPVQWAGPRRFFAPTLDLAQLPKIDAVVISHDHYDHLGKKTATKLAELYPNMRWIAPVGVAKILHGFGVRQGLVTELDWTQNSVVKGRESGAEVTVTAVPTRHFSGRSLFNRNHTLWAAFILQGTCHRVYCGADSGLWDGFATIGKEYGPFDLVMLEIGAFNELWKDIHLGPDGALEAFRALGGGTLMPIHWGLFDLALHAWRDPIARLLEIADQSNIRVFSPEPGLPTDFSHDQDVRSHWWRPSGVTKSPRA
jgi:L-ascorbate metabolism protein UlaG (beta-lactamase superfamily)